MGGICASLCPNQEPDDGQPKSKSPPKEPAQQQSPKIVQQEPQPLKNGNKDISPKNNADEQEAINKLNAKRSSDTGSSHITFKDFIWIKVGKA